MSLKGKATADKLLRGKINGLETLKGYSAYEIALIHGFEGTEEEWLASLKGEKGNDAEGAILYTKQTLTEGQQAQARSNIGVEQAQRVSIGFAVGYPPDAALADKTFAELRAFLVSNTEIIADLELQKGDTQYRATTQTVYCDEDTQVCFDFAGLGVLRVDNENLWYFAEHNSGGSIIQARVG